MSGKCPDKRICSWSLPDLVSWPVALQFQLKLLSKHPAWAINRNFNEKRDARAEEADKEWTYGQQGLHQILDHELISKLYVRSFARKGTNRRTVLAVRRLKVDSEKEAQGEFVGEEGDEAEHRVVVQAALWFLAGGYVVWLFILPNAPGDPVWAISPDTISMLIDLSLNFFYVLPILNAGGVHVMESPVVHPTAEALFNLVLGWTVMFAPLLFTDRKRDRFKGPLELWWIFQMFLTNTFLIPYMAIRLNASEEKEEKETSPALNEVSGKSLHFPKLSSAMTSGALTVAATGSVIGVLTVLWFFLGRGEFGNFTDRWNFFLSYVCTDRVAYAFIWDLVLYSAFQPWLIGDNLSNLEKNKVELVSKLRFVPYVGLIAYLWGLPGNRKL